MRRASLALATLALATLALAARADAFVYWTSPSLAYNTIGRANLDGNGADQGFITIDTSKALIPIYIYGVAIDGAYVYWAEENRATPNDSTIFRANLDGSPAPLRPGSCDSGVARDLVEPPHGIAVDGAHVYWTHGTSIGRANVDRTAVNESFITGAVAAPSTTDGVAVDGAHIYWTDGSSGTIGRANLDSTGANPNFITGASGPAGVAVDGAHVYWANNASGTIGRANLDGSNPNQSFITGAGAPAGLAVDGAHVYWANSASGALGRANLDGSSPNQSFVASSPNPLGLAVDALSAAPASTPVSAEFDLGKAKLNKERGSAKLTADVSLPGTLHVERTKSVESGSVLPTDAGKMQLSIKPRGKAKKKLNETGEAKVTAKVTYTPACAPSETKSKQLKLVKQ